jgi:5'-deoxynucleotidase YfbR-like HD superfamily hydrolase
MEGQGAFTADKFETFKQDYRASKRLNGEKPYGVSNNQLLSRMRNSYKISYMQAVQEFVNHLRLVG